MWTPEDARARQSEQMKVDGFDAGLGSAFTYQQGVEYGDAEQIYDIGPSIGWKAGEHLRLGVGLWVHYRLRCPCVLEFMECIEAVLVGGVAKTGKVACSRG